MLTQSMHDPCVFLSEKMRIVLYVDDLFISYDDEEELEKIQDVIINQFGGEIKHPIDGCLEFLCMKFQIKDKGVFITMPAKIDDVTEGIDKTSQTPTGP